MNEHYLINQMLESLDPEEVLKELNRLHYEESLYEFFRAGWKYIDPSEFCPGAPLQAVCEHLEAVAYGDIKRLIINIPPRMSKSSMTSVAFPAWTWAQRYESPTSGPGTQFLHASYSHILSLRDSVKCRRLIESPWYRELWGDRFRLTSDQNTKTRFDNSRSGSRYCTSVGATLTGEGGNIIIVDDPNAAQEAFSEATIATTIEWWDSALSTRLNNLKDGAFIIIQQRLAENDLTGHILEKNVGDWTHLMLPMRYESDRAALIYPNKIGWMDWRTEEGELLWPERFAEEEVNSLERTLGPFSAAGQLQQRPEIKGGGVIKREWWTLWDQPQWPQIEYVVASLDTAYTTKQENDFSAMSVWGVFSGESVAQANKILGHDGRVQNIQRVTAERAPNAIMTNAWQERLEFHDLITKVVDTCRKYKVDRLLIENKAAGHSVAQELRRIYNNEDFAVQLVDPKNQDKLARLYSIQHIFSEGMIWAPDTVWSDMVISQVAMFPKGTHDDIVDTVSMAVKHMRDTGLLVRGQERLEEINESMQFKGNNQHRPIYTV